MSRSNETVQEFRSIVESVIDDAYNESSPIAIIGDQHNKTSAAGLLFAHIHAGQSEDGRFDSPDSKEYWSVVGEEKIEVGKYVGSLIILSLVEVPDALIRQVYFGQSAYFGTGIASQLNPEESAKAVEWVRSPHLNTGIAIDLITLRPDELVDIERQFREDRQASAAFRKELRTYDDSQRGLPDGFFDNILK